MKSIGSAVRAAITFTCLCALFSSHTNAASQTASKLFKIPTGSAPGSCDQHDLDTVISQAIAMAKAAVAAIEAFQNVGFLSRATPSLRATQDHAWAMFGIVSGGGLGLLNLPSAGKTTLDEVKSQSLFLHLDRTDLHLV